MADVSLDQISELLDEKLRPIKAALDEHSRKLDQQAERPEHHLKRFLAALFIVVAVIAVVLAGRALMGRLDSGPGQSSAPASGRLLYADDFSNPAKGLFLDHQKGKASLPADRASAAWDYAYQGGELVAHVGPPSLPLAGRVIGGSARALNRVTGDFAFEVRARATRSPANAVYGLRYFPGSREFGFGIRPGQKSYQFWEIFRPPLLAAQTTAIAPDESDNVLRLEVHGNTLRLFANGQMLDSVQDDAFTARPASVGLFFDTAAAPTGESVEMRYSDFKVYSLGS
ncbi:MAG TPA: hypothetical protein VMW62_05360 [Chloroflexota bacterium]|nr:hypothetical protein [Chloroflexota bacterium]